MSRSFPSRLLASAVLALGLTVGVAVQSEAAAPVPQAGPVLPAKKKFVPPAAVSWVGGKDLIGTGTLTDLPAGVKPPPAPKAAAWLVADLDSREILAAKNVHVPLAPASTLKIFTSLALAPRLDPKQIYTGQVADSQIDGTKVGVVAGSRYTVDDLLHGMLMSSGNDCANALGTLAGGKAKAISLIQAEATSLGAFDTVVRSTSGLDAKGQVSSAYDLALAGSAALQNPQLAKIMTMPAYSFPGKGVSMGPKRAHYQTQNHNRLLGYLPGMTGVKNGYTEAALGSNVGSATYKGHRYIAVIMRADGTVFTPTGDLLQWAFKYGQRANSVGTLIRPGELTAMTGPGVLASAQPTPTALQRAAEAGPDDLSAALPASSSLAGENSQSSLTKALRLWPIALAAALLLGLFSLTLRRRTPPTRRRRH